MKVETINVGLGSRSYTIRVGDGLMAGIASEISPFLNRPRVAIVTDSQVAELHAPKLLGNLETSGIAADLYAVQPGEASKSWDSLRSVAEWLIDLKAERGDVVLAFGGGVVGDLAGFAAAIVKRGLGVIQVPTSLLAQVDSAIGGKTGINSQSGKNLIGAFHQPLLVLSDLECLTTLSGKELRSGYGEIAKYGLLGDSAFFAWLEANGAAILAGDRSAQGHAVLTSSRIKADIVASDETEAGHRAVLNLGHTFAHAIEAALGYADSLSHGEAVAIGCCLAFDLAGCIGICDSKNAQRVRHHFRSINMRTDLRDIGQHRLEAATLMRHMGQDKKVVAGQNRFILPRRIGDVGLYEDVDRQLLETVLLQSAQT